MVHFMHSLVCPLLSDYFKMAKKFHKNWNSLLQIKTLLLSVKMLSKTVCGKMQIYHLPSTNKLLLNVQFYDVSRGNDKKTRTRAPRTFLMCFKGGVVDFHDEVFCNVL